jgi:1-acyl-sn-glycerol-3-phosphate acyltransferase
MGATTYRALRLAARLVRVQTIRPTYLNLDRVDRDDGCVLACTHLSHIEPVLLSVAMRRQVHWMARREFYHTRVATFFLNRSGAIQIDRFGFPIAGIRSGASMAATGRCVGIFPEGGVTQGSESVLRGGPIKGGVCTIAIQADVPVVPVAVLGTDRLTTVRSWVPIPRKPVIVAIGEDIRPPAKAASRRSRRLQMVEAVVQGFQQLYAETISQLDIGDAPITQAVRDPSTNSVS